MYVCAKYYESLLSADKSYYNNKQAYIFGPPCKWLTNALNWLEENDVNGIQADFTKLSIVDLAVK